MGATVVSEQDQASAEQASADEGIELVPDNGDKMGMWCAMRLGSLGMSPDDGDFWSGRAAELKELGWDEMDWDFIREQLATVAKQLEDFSTDEPEIVLPGKTARERVFLERWFGYGAPCVSAQLKGSRARVACGDHRIRAVANYPFTESDAAALGLAQASFSAGESLPPNTMVPILVF